MPTSVSGASKVPAKFGIWKRLAVLALAFAALGLLGSVLLFSGSEVECVEGAAERGLELRCDFDVAASPLAVFEAFTATGEPRPFYFDAVLEAEMRAGGRWRFVSEDLKRLLASGKVVVIEPPRRFVQTFEAADLDDPRAESLSSCTKLLRAVA